jgi:hypothetical protein
MAEKRPSDFRGEWDTLKHEAVVLESRTTRGLPVDDPAVKAEEAAVAALNAGKDAVAHKAWMSTARDLADLELLAEIVFDYFWDIATFPQLPADIDDRDQREVAVAYLVRGVFDAGKTIAQGDIGGTQP